MVEIGLLFFIVGDFGFAPKHRTSINLLTMVGCTPELSHRIEKLRCVGCMLRDDGTVGVNSIADHDEQNNSPFSSGDTVYTCRFEDTYCRV